MSVRDYNKQVARRQRIGSTALVVGVDIGSASNAVGSMNKEGKVLGSYPKMLNSREGLRDAEASAKRILEAVTFSDAGQFEKCVREEVVRLCRIPQRLCALKNTEK